MTLCPMASATAAAQQLLGVRHGSYQIRDLLGHLGPLPASIRRNICAGQPGRCFRLRKWLGEVLLHLSHAKYPRGHLLRFILRRAFLVHPIDIGKLFFETRPLPKVLYPAS